MTVLHALFLAVLVPAMALLHRLRGGGIVTLPVKGTYVLWPIVGVLAWFAGAAWPVALAWSVGYLLWILPAGLALGAMHPDPTRDGVLIVQATAAGVSLAGASPLPIKVTALR